MRKRIFEDFLLNKLYGYYLILYGNDHHLLARLVFKFGQTAISFMTFIRLIPPRIQPSYSYLNEITPASISKSIDYESIREKAYFLWAEKGYPENCDIDNWLEAEQQICY